MKSTGIVRKVDELGRITIPKEIRKTWNIDNDTPMEIFTNNEKEEIVIRKFKYRKAVDYEKLWSELINNKMIPSSFREHLAELENKHTRK